MTPAGRSAYGLLGRQPECEHLGTLLQEVEQGHGAALVVRGEFGVGKTALLDWVAATASDFKVVRVTGVEAEADLAFGALHQLCVPFMSRVPELPEPQAAALAAVFGLRETSTPDRFLIGLALLSLLSLEAIETPLLCIVDDAQWLDTVSAQTLAFAARRLGASRIALIVSLRDGGPTAGWAELPALHVNGLQPRDARVLLDQAAPGRMEVVVRERILAEARGNPLALLELPRDVAAATIPVRAGDEILHSSQIHEGFRRQVEVLDEDTRRLLLLAAAEPVGDTALLRRASDLMSLAFDRSITQAAHEQLITSGPMLRFRHPMLRSTIYNSATADERREVHRALADATDVVKDPDRRSWHYANASTGPDEAVAASLEQTAARARSRGGVASAAAFLERAFELTPPGAERTSRALAAAESLHQAGDYKGAIKMLDLLHLMPLDAPQRARADLIRGRTTSASQGGRSGVSLILGAAEALGATDAALAYEAYRDALFTSMTAGQVDGDGGVVRIARAIKQAPEPPGPSENHLLLRGLAVAIDDGLGHGLEQLRQGLQGIRRCSHATLAGTSWLPVAIRAAHDSWDFETQTLLSAQLMEAATESGVLSLLPTALLLQLFNRVYAGEVDTARMLAEQATSLAEVTGSKFLAHYCDLVVAPWQGDEELVRSTVETLAGGNVLDRHDQVGAPAAWSLAVLYNGLGRFEEAFEAAMLGARHPSEMGLATWSIVELVEAASKLDRVDRIHEVAALLDEQTQTAATDWALATRAFVAAMTADVSRAEARYREALEIAARTPVAMLNARIHLSFGEWLLACERRVDARHWLNVAHSLFRDAAATGYAARALRALAAAGVVKDSARPRSTAPLTSQELQIARLAADGLTNPEIGAQLFISAHTVEWHLRKVFTKLGIRSRRDIAGSLELC